MTSLFIIFYDAKIAKTRCVKVVSFISKFLDDPLNLVLHPLHLQSNMQRVVLYHIYAGIVITTRWCLYLAGTTSTHRVYVLRG